MNKRINELKQSAGVDYNPDQEGLDLFAQLIVEECAQDFDNTYMTGGETMGNYIRRKFGTEL
jgi:hypothetical protein